MKALIIEDELPAARRLQSLLTATDYDLEVVDVLESAKASVQWLKKNPHPDIIFMDIQLSDNTSFSIFDLIEVKSPVVFTTAYDEFALQAFKVNSIDYLLKPVELEELRKSLKKWESWRGILPFQADPALGASLQAQVSGTAVPYKSRFLVKLGEQFMSVKVEEVAYFTSENKVTFLHTFRGKKFYLDCTLEELETLIDPVLFFRLNRQCISALDAITKIHTYFNGKLKVILKGVGEPVIVSKEKAPRFKVWLNQ